MSINEDTAAIGELKNKPSGTGGIATAQTSQKTVLDQPFLASVQVNWETLAWATLLVIAAVSRFYQLGVRAMSHDESLHALYSYYLYNAGNYEHNPMMHGPFLFHLNALVYFLFGDNDTTARLGPALAGLGVLALIAAYRRYIGRLGALAAGILVAISPSILFHSRYIRNDIYIALFTLVWIYGAFRFLDSPKEHKMRWLIVMVLGMAFGFITKENHFMHGAIIGAFFAVLAMWQVIQGRVFTGIAPILFGGAIAFWLYESGQTNWALAVAGIGAVASAVLLILWIGKAGWLRLWSLPAADLAVIMLTLVMPFTAPFGHALLGWDPMAYGTTSELVRSGVLVAVTVCASIAIAFLWFGLRKSDQSRHLVSLATWGKLMAIFWVIQILFFTTFLTNTRNGLATGIVGSLGYWLAQQEVARGGQPWYYYFMLSGLYEFLPVFLTIGGGASLLHWLGSDEKWEPTVPSDLPSGATDSDVEEDAGEHQRIIRVYFVVFLLWWVLASWIAYTVAGEKMPWLMTHLALPMAVFGGWWFGRFLGLIKWHDAIETKQVWLVGMAPALVFVAGALILGFPTLGRTTVELAAVSNWVLALLTAVGLGYLTVRWVKQGGLRTSLRLLFVGLVALMFLLAVRFSYMLNYINYDMVTEYLVYAHASPDVKRALREIDLISERTVGGRNIVVAYDDDSSWPLSWYMRLYPNSRFYGNNPNTDVMSAPVIIVGPQNYEKVRPYVARDYVKRTYRLVWWPDQGYFNLTWDRFWNTISDREKMKRLFEIVFYRRYRDDQNPAELRNLMQWPNRHDFEMYVRRDIAAEIWDLGVAPIETADSQMAGVMRQVETEVYALEQYRGQFGDTALLRPRDVAVGKDGRRVIADAGNHRIVVLDREGNFLFSFGSECRLGEGEAGGCQDPDGSGPLELGDGQFYEPWGVAATDDGQIVVADTWNGRIQIFDSSGAFVRKWGYFNSTNGDLGDPFALFGPRGVTLSRDGNLIVADTGNKRILIFDRDGNFVNQIGGGGVILGRFEEPVDVAVDPADGSIFVSDAWNRRIQKLTADLTPLEEWPVPGRDSREIYHKPYLAVSENGDVYTTDPAFYRVVVFGPDGAIKSAFGDYGMEDNRFGLPNGITVDYEQGTLLVADADNDRILVLPLVP